MYSDWYSQIKNCVILAGFIIIQSPFEAETIHINQYLFAAHA